MKVDKDKFNALSDKDQNLQLFKILTAIATEIDLLKQNVEKRFTVLETIINQQSRVDSAAVRRWQEAKPMTKGYPQNGGYRNDQQPSETDASRPSSWPTQKKLEQFDTEQIPEAPVIINVGGIRFYVTWSLLQRLPQTRLGKLKEMRYSDQILNLCDKYNLEENEFYFDRHPRSFGAIVNFYRTGKLHLGEEGCVIAFKQDLDYWGIDELYLEPCCQQRYYQTRELMSLDRAEKVEEPEYFRPGAIGRIQKCLWDLFEKPHTSLGAKVVAIISILFIIISTIVLTLNTLPYFQAGAGEGGDETEEIDYPLFSLAEAIYMSWFTFELLIRLISCPDKCKFVKTPMNVIDLLAVLPYYVSLILLNTNSNSGELTEVRRIAQFFRIMRIVRIFKLARHSTGLQSLGYTLKNSYKELGLLMLFITMGILIFASLTFVFEKENVEDTKFETMLDAYWWALITMTTVGYGDIAPTTALGRVCGSMCAICGVLVVALPIPIIGNNFANFYKSERRKEQIDEKRKALEKKKREGQITPFGENLGLNVTELEQGYMGEDRRGSYLINRQNGK
ncbi:potassium voltage-gated channel protein Shab [Eurytemora carolleeae]|uniref:potassium voltage-gated channel protein Shab n=1 Tax=Eurytemora carolleeae TaxID=1294199 RepID=UPI000C766929|nr:potassium voltage-gated channel protein Shab [Eurytemora carolleeae]|eukprot:XP_023321006.1 potassium voltage-gated channel protein Shab-like [Eurytemora affinis]